MIELFAFTMIAILYIQKNGTREYLILCFSCFVFYILFDCIEKFLF